MKVLNPGYMVLNREHLIPNSKRTVICCGLGRSGTSAIASILRFIGVPLGDQVTPSSLEDLRIAKAFEHNHLESLMSIIDDYNSRYEIWGFKRPSFRSRLHMLKFFRAPMLIVPHRNVLGITLRNSLALSGHDCGFDTMLQTLANNKKFLEELRQYDFPQMHISFSALESRPDDIGQALAEFLGLTCPDGLSDYLQSNRENYLNVQKPRVGRVSQ